MGNKEVIVFDGKTPCKRCKRVICQECQGQDPSCVGCHDQDCPLFKD